ncbi:MAG: aconitate hydratase AcnA [Alphaproteobacteria bacterium]
MSTTKSNRLQMRKTLQVGQKNYTYYSLDAAAQTDIDIRRLPFSLKGLLENLLRHEDGVRICSQGIHNFVRTALAGKPDGEVLFNPTRVLMQDFTGVPALVDLAAMRDAMVKLNKDPAQINPLVCVDLVVDHSVIADSYGDTDSLKKNVALEYSRNAERYAFLRWGQAAFDNCRVVPPGTGICHQVNLEYLAQVVWVSTDKDGTLLAYPDTVVGTDSHTTMVNGLSVLGWGVGGIEAEAVMLRQPLAMLAPAVIGFKLVGKLPEGATATDLVLTLTQILRARGVVGKFVEYFGSGLDSLSLEDRATVANMAPEYGATCGFFPIDQKTIDYLAFTGRDPERIALVEAYAKVQGLWYNNQDPEPIYADVLTLDLAAIQPALAGPKRPQDRVLLEDAKRSCEGTIKAHKDAEKTAYPLVGKSFPLTDGDVVIAAITSCTNTSNPAVMMSAGLLARKARAAGLSSKPWVKTSLAPGSQIVTDYLAKSGLDQDLQALGFHLVGYGCTTCIGNSGPFDPAITQAINENEMVVCAMLSGNRNFEARIHPLVKANYLASPPLVVAYAIAGTVALDLTTEPLGVGSNGQSVFLKDIWPSNAEITAAIRQFMTPEMFRQRYAEVFKGDEHWQKIPLNNDQTYSWDPKSTYVKNPPYFDNFSPQPAPLTDITGARILAVLGDSITTDHISPAGSIKSDGPAGRYLLDNAVSQENFNAYGTRRGNHEVMVRGTFANIRIHNEMTPERTGGYTRHWPSQEILSIYDASLLYQEQGTPLVVIAGREYGTGSSRDWAAKGTRLLGIKAIIAESYERIHRSNLIGMGVLPLEFPNSITRKTLKLTGEERVSIHGLEAGLATKMLVDVTVEHPNGHRDAFKALCRLDTQDDLDYFTHGGILPYILRLQ